MRTGVQVSDAMTKEPVVMKPEENLHTVATTMEKSHVGSIIISQQKKLLGIITEQDIVRKVIAKNLDPYKTKVKDVMETDMITIHGEQDVYDALVLMKQHNIRHLPVMSNGKMSGFLTIKDILKIQPQLFDLMVEKFELREEEDKPIRQILKHGQMCPNCGAIRK